MMSKLKEWAKSKLTTDTKYVACVILVWVIVFVNIWVCTTTRSVRGILVLLLEVPVVYSYWKWG